MYYLKQEWIPLTTKLRTSFATLGYFSEIIKRDTKGTKKNICYISGLFCRYCLLLLSLYTQRAAARLWIPGVLHSCRSASAAAQTERPTLGNTQQNQKNMLHRCHLALWIIHARCTLSKFQTLKIPRLNLKVPRFPLCNTPWRSKVGNPVSLIHSSHVHALNLV